LCRKRYKNECGIAFERRGALLKTAITMPQLGETVAEGTVVRWLKNVGDSVAVDEPILEISTDKVDTEIVSTASGSVGEIVVSEGVTVAVGSTLAWLETESDTSTATPVDEPKANPAPSALPEPRASVAEQRPRRPSPLIRKLLEEAGLDASEVHGTGPNGRITRDDVASAVSMRSSQPASPVSQRAGSVSQQSSATLAAIDVRAEPLTRLRKVIADRMMTSLHTSAQLTSVVEIDVSRVATLRSRAKAHFEAREGVKLSFLPFFAKAALEALKAHPTLNAQIDIDGGQVLYHTVEHLGVAVDTERGLFVPVIRHASDLSLAGLARKIAELAGQVRDNKISPEDLAGGTFTITNTGSRGALFDTPIINPPQVAILGTGEVVKRPVVITDRATGDESIAVKSMAYFALTYDHRLIDGAEAARFLTTIKRRLEEGAFVDELGLPDAGNG
jgi:pyruvate dehydrogenase E2 component (dihydrolipoamide acetyltransferase)